MDYDFMIEILKTPTPYVPTFREELMRSITIEETPTGFILIWKNEKIDYIRYVRLN